MEKRILFSLFFLVLFTGVLAANVEDGWDNSNLDDEFVEGLDDDDIVDNFTANDSGNELDQGLDDDFENSSFVDDFDEDLEDNVSDDTLDDGFDEGDDFVDDSQNDFESDFDNNYSSTTSFGEREYSFTDSFWLAIVFIGVLILIVVVFLFFFFRAPKNKWEKNKAVNNAPKGNVVNSDNAGVGFEKKAGFFDKFKIKIKK